MKLRWLIIVLLMPVTAAFDAEQSGTADNLRIIQVDGHGEARANPDQALIGFSIETKALTAKEASAQNAQMTAKVITALKSKVAPGDKIYAGGYALQPLYSVAAGNPVQSDIKVRDWLAEKDVQVQIDPSMVGVVLDAAQAVGVVGSSMINEDAGRATVSVQVQSRALTATEATRLAAERTRKMAAVIREKIGGKNQLSIANARVQAESDQVSYGQVAIGYQVTNSISVETGATDQIGPLTDTAIAAGVSHANGVTLELLDDSKARSEAIADACKDAQLKATAAAQAFGLKVRRIVKITAGDFRNQLSGERGVAGSFTKPLKPNEVIVPAMVTVTYELE